jgi:uncharacterized protein (TIGR02145 family)
MKRIVAFLILVFLFFSTVLINSCKKESVIPTLTTTAVTDITVNSATTGGLISKDGGAAVTARGVCWSTSALPSITGSHTSDDKGTGSFTSSLTDLTPNTLYHVRAYATNSVGTAYGNEVTFTTTPIVLATLTTTAITSVTLTTAASGGNITSDGNGAITARGVCWAITSGPTITNSLTTDGTGSGTFTSSISGLLPSTTYYVRAYATNSAGTAYGNEISFTTSAIVVPTLTTTIATAITLTTATSGGNITADGGGAVTARGTCWATTANPTITGSKTTDGTGTGIFTSSLTGLLPGVTYHIRAYATNSVGTAYGNDLSFTTTAIVVPTLTTTAATAITLTTATSGGNITADGGGTVTARGVCWSTTANPAITDAHSTDGTGTGVFTSSLTSLLPGTTYHIRAYATNSAGTAYGTDLSFTTTTTTPTLTTAVATSITLTTAVSGGTITSNGGALITVSGICWSTSSNPSVTDSHTTDGTATGTFTSSLTGLSAGTLYHVRAYATNSAGTAYGNDISFTTVATVPTLTTTAVTSITLTTAVSGGTITSNGGALITVSGICWSTTANPLATGSHTTDGTTSGSFSSSLTGLTAGTTYHVRAYATNSAGTAYGNDLSFTTTSTVPTLTTAAITSITLTTAVSGGTITSNGGATITVSGVCWGATANPLVTDSHSTDGTTSGTFVSNLTGLTSGTLYHVRAYATNSAGTAYGNDLSFTTTAPVIPTLTTTAITSIDETTAVSGGNITSDGGGAVTARGVCWATTTSPVATGSHTSDGTSTGIFTSNITGLTGGTTYYVRAYATNSAGTAYGNQISFNSKLADVDGNKYNVVMIGTQMWMAENLKTTKLNDNTAISNIAGNAAWAADSSIGTPAYCWYNNDENTYKPLFGALYNYFAVNTGNICPTGWHAPADADFSTLEATLGMTNAQIILGWAWRGTNQGTQLKSTTIWNINTGTNTSGFTALPGGYRYYKDGSFFNAGDLSYWWTTSAVDATTAYYRRLDGNQTGVYRAGVNMGAGKYVRCVKN